MDSESQLAVTEPTRFRIKAAAIAGCLPLLVLTVAAVATGQGRPWTVLALALWIAVTLVLIARWLRAGIDVHPDRIVLHHVRRTETVMLTDVSVRPAPVPDRFAALRRRVPNAPIVSRTTGERVRLPVPVSHASLDRAIASQTGQVQQVIAEHKLDRLVEATSSPHRRGSAVRAALR